VLWGGVFGAVRALRGRGWSLPVLLAIFVALASLMPGAMMMSGTPALGRAAGAGGSTAQAPSGIPQVDITVGGIPLGRLGAIEQGVALASADALVPALGGSIVHLPATPDARIFLGGHVVTAMARRTDVNVDGRQVAMPVPPLVIDGQFYIPVGPLAEAAGYDVRWPGRGGSIAVDPIPAPRLRLSAPAAAADLAEAPPASSAPAAAAAPPTPPAPTVPPAVIPYTGLDLNLMARVVHGEAAGQPTQAKVGVAAVIVNRVRGPGWPKTIAGVIYAPGQFQAVGAPLFEQSPSAADVQAALDALRGADPTGGATFFYNPAQTWSGSWIFTRTTLVTIGAFRFAR